MVITLKFGFGFWFVVLWRCVVIVCFFVFVVGLLFCFLFVVLGVCGWY